METTQNNSAENVPNVTNAIDNNIQNLEENEDACCPLCKDEVANCLVIGGRICRNEYGVNNVFISSIMPRENSAFQGNRHRLNKVLRGMCIENGFNFIDNNNIVLSTHGHHDGIHLNYDGSDLLCNNLLDILNG